MLVPDANIKDSGCWLPNGQDRHQRYLIVSNTFRLQHPSPTSVTNIDVTTLALRLGPSHVNSLIKYQFHETTLSILWSETRKSSSGYKNSSSAYNSRLTCSFNL